MTDYIVSEEVLKQLLGALDDEAAIYIDNDPEDGPPENMVEVMETLRDILSNPPAEPAFWMDDYRNMEDTFKPWMQDEIDRGVGWEPLFRKDL